MFSSRNHRGGETPFGIFIFFLCLLALAAAGYVFRGSLSPVADITVVEGRN